MSFIYNEFPRDVEKWNKKIKSKVIKKKVNKIDENETEFVDVDLVLSFYMDEFREVRRKTIAKIIK